jgi:serine protease AprX
MEFFNLSTGKRVRFAFALLLLFANSFLNGQSPSFNYFYRVYFKDKGNNVIGNYAPEDLLSTRALIRREKAGIAVPDFRDLPVCSDYINQISASGLDLHCVSKWMNTAVFRSQSAININTLLDLPFINDVKIVKTPGKKSNRNLKPDILPYQAELPPFDRPVTMVNGNSLHNSGYDGKGVLIAILDGGFLNADHSSSLTELHSKNGIKATYDFVNNKPFVYSYSNHGTEVLSILAGMIPGLIEGTACGADYLLLKTEDIESEFPCEEDFWAAGAEYADSSGADIISSSLGYYDFDDPALNHKFVELDGNTAFITIAADIAASKGILVVNSAGNERDKLWKRIIFPADGDSVLAVGAVDGNGYISYFSSAGPSADGRVKPDNVTMGVSVPVQTSSGNIGRSNGTSFSCPILSGMAACLMQAVPKAINTDIIEAIHTSGDKFNSPDTLYGYGIPDMGIALENLQEKYIKIPFEETIVGPNPTSGNINIIFREPPENLTIEIISMSGKILFSKKFPYFAGRTLNLTELQKAEQGIYFIRLIKSTGINVHKIIKLKN